MRLLKENLTKSVYNSLTEDFNLPSDEDIESEVEKYRTSQLDKMAKHDEEEELKHQEMLKYFKDQKKDYLKNRKNQLKKYRDDNDPTEERLNAKREELRQKREKDREDYQRWFEEAKKDKGRYFSDVNALTDLANKENPGDFKYGGFNVCFTYNGKSYWVGWYDSDVYLPSDHRDGYYQWEYGYEIPNSDVHKWKREINPIKEMSPEEFGLEVKPGSKDRVKGIIDLNKLGGSPAEPKETSNEAIAKELDSLGEGYSLGDDKDSFDVWEEKNKELEEIIKFIKSYKSVDLDEAIKNVEHSQDNIYTADIMLTGLKEEDIEKEDELNSSIIDRYPFINNIQISKWYGDDVVCFIDFDISGVYNKHKSDLVVVIRRVLEAIGR